MSYLRSARVTLVVAATMALLPASTVAQALGAAPATDCGTKFGQTPAWQHVTVIVFENKTLPQIIGNTTDAPYLNSLASACSYATNMNHLSTVSLANYVALTSGYTGHSNGREMLITGTKLPRVWPQDSVSIFELLGDDAREWAESMPGNCYMANDLQLFEVGHTPFQYYTRTQNTLCPRNAVPLGSKDPMSARFNLLIPNRVDDMHSTTLTKTAKARIQAGDAWASSYIPTMLASPEYQDGHGAIILTWDEANTKTSKTPFIVISPYTKAAGTTNVQYNHYSTLKGVEQMLGVSPLLGHAADSSVASIADDTVLGLG